jgi:hypothetical protein
MFGLHGLKVIKTQPKSSKFGVFVNSSALNNDYTDLNMVGSFSVPSREIANELWNERKRWAKIESIVGLINFGLISTIVGIFMYYLFF